MYVIVMSNLFTHESPKSSRSSFKVARAFLVELKFEDAGFCGGRKTGVPGEKTLGDPEYGNRTQATLEGGECYNTAPYLQFVPPYPPPLKG